MNPPLPSEISSLEPTGSPSEFPGTFRGGGVWIFSGTTQSGANLLVFWPVTSPQKHRRKPLVQKYYFVYLLAKMVSNI